MFETEKVAPAIIKLDRAGAVATVTLNRPDKFNAMIRASWVALAEAFEQLSADMSLRCVIVRGAGERAFCPGADISEFDAARATAAQARAYGDDIKRALYAIRDCPHPVVAQIYGPCTGGGLEIATMCDLRLAGASARVGIPINRIGVVLAYPEYEALLDLVGRGVAMEMLLEARVFNADEALARGLLTRVVPDADLAAELEASVARIVSGAPLSNRWHKKSARRLAEARPLTEDEYNEPYRAVETEDYRIGTQAFLAKRKPEFRGR
ncbi:MAG: enoyl-CoA hydratase/isomerase family protein [Alphaproteobacteria bacterium]